MIISCPECETKFMVNAEALGSGGRKVRCGKCEHIWMQKPLAPEDAKKEKDAISEQKENLKEAVRQQAEGVAPSLPVIVVSIKSLKRLKFAAAFLLMVNVLVFVGLNKDMIGQTSFYDHLGQYDTKGVEIAEAKILPAQDPKKILAQWSVKNTTKTIIRLPARRVSLLDKDFKQITSATNTQKAELAANELSNFKPTPLPNNPKAKYLVLEIGNPHELSVR